MKKILNLLFLVLKFILLIASFGFTFYIILSMYTRVEKNIIDSFPIFIPYLLLLLLFLLNIVLRQKSINDNLFYNLVCCLVFGCNCLVGIRSIFDKNMILNKIMGYNINFSYYSDYIVFMKMMMYSLVLSNIVFILTNKMNNAKKVEIAHKIEVL